MDWFIDLFASFDYKLKNWKTYHIAAFLKNVRVSFPGN